MFRYSCLSAGAIRCAQDALELPGEFGERDVQTGQQNPWVK